MRYFETKSKSEEGPLDLASAIVVGVPMLNLCVAGYLFVSALIAANSGGEMSIATGWAVTVSASSGVLLAVALFWLARRARQADRALSMRRALAARRALARPVLRSSQPAQKSFGPSPITVVVRRQRQHAL